MSKEGFSACPFDHENNPIDRVNVLGEIVMAKNFVDCDDMLKWFLNCSFIKYELALPNWWRFDNEGIEDIDNEYNIASSVTHSSTLEMDKSDKEVEGTIAHFGFPIDLQFAVDNNNRLISFVIFSGTSKSIFLLPG